MRNNHVFKMGSLFDGSGGFPLASALCGIEPVWASEIEPFPIRVTKKRFPQMKHLGDVSSIDISKLEPVDLVSGGSPCQDMSVAGKRHGMSKKCPKCSYSIVGNADIKECPECEAELEYTRSGLFMEQIRIVKEMRKKDECRNGTSGEHIRPRFMLWENVVGAFSSNKGEDFRAVLEETAKIKDKSVIIPRPPKGKWKNAGLIMGDGYSIAWRVLDAQYWGVPQRRRRIALVADFGGECAGEILFKRDGLQRNFTESRKAWQTTTGDSAESTGEASKQYAVTVGSQSDTIHMNPEKSQTLCAGQGGKGVRTGLYCLPKKQQYAVDFGRTADRIQMNADKSVTITGEGGGTGAKTGLYCLPKNNHQKEPYTMNTKHFCHSNKEKADTLLSTDYKEPQAVFYPVKKDLYCMATQQGGAEIMNDLAPTITASAGMSGNNQPVINQSKKAYGIGSYASNAMKSDNPNSGIYEADTARTLDLNGGNPACNQGGIAICEPVCAFEPGIAKREGSENRFMEDKAPTIRANMGDNQVGVAYSLQGNMIGREDHNGPQGNGVNQDVSFTLNATDKHAVVYGIDRAAFNQGENALYNFSIEEDKAQTLVAKGPGAVGYEQKSSYWDGGQIAGTLTARNANGAQRMPDKDNFNAVVEEKSYQDKTGTLMASGYDKLGTQEVMNDMFVANEYIVRRLTPLECGRLQGFPDWWTDNLKTENPNGYDIAFWREVFETHRKIVTGASKPKTDKQILKWLTEEPRDGAKYKMWGNGIALPCFLYVIEGIKEVLDRTLIATINQHHKHKKVRT